MSTPPIIIVTGPTASGKSSFAEHLAMLSGGSIINADVAQMYTALSIGTAKPDWQASPIPQYLFDAISTPTDTTVVTYRSMVIAKVEELAPQGKPIIIVGGSLFYVTSLFYPPLNIADNPTISREQVTTDHNLTPWENLNRIDPERAAELHPNDLYRVERALAIWKNTGKKPSAQKPVYVKPFDATVVCINPPREILFERINKRVDVMLEQGWIEEAEKLMGTPWQTFTSTKGFIGYPELFTWIKNGKKKEDLPTVIATIQQQTRVYAKRQCMFWRRLATMLQKETPQPRTIEFKNGNCTSEIKKLLGLEK